MIVFVIGMVAMVSYVTNLTVTLTFLNKVYLKVRQGSLIRYLILAIQVIICLTCSILPVIMIFLGAKSILQKDHISSQDTSQSAVSEIIRQLEAQL